MRLDLRTDLVTLLRQIVDVESVSGNEKRLADLVYAALEPLPHLRLNRSGNVIVASTQLNRAERVLIAGHLDTVPVADNLPSELVEVDGELRVTGRGSCDMKGGVTVALSLAASLTNPNRDISWVFYDNEEVAAELNGLNRIVAENPDWLAGDFAVLMEPTAAQVEGGCQGACRIMISVEGKAAHAARSWLGQNAIHGLQDVLERLNNYQPRQIEVEGLVYREGLNAVHISGGVAGNVVPPTAQIEINYRFAPDKTPEQALVELRRIFAGYDFEVTDMSPAAKPGLDRPIAAAFVDSVGGEPKPKYGWTDVARFAELGVPAVNYGPGDAGLAHTKQEYVPAHELEECAAGLRGWLS